MYYYLWNGSSLTTPFVLENEANEISFGEVDRAYDNPECISDNTIIDGIGNLKPRMFSFSILYKAGSSTTSWNAKRAELLKLMAKPKWDALYLYCVDAAGVARRARVYPKNISNETIASLRVSNSVTYSFFMETAYFEALNESSATSSIADANASSVAITIAGDVATSPEVNFTAKTSFSDFNIQLASGYGFTLTGNFSSGDDVSVNCKTGVITINGVESPEILSAGTIFKLQPGANTLIITADVCDVSINYYERYL